MNVQEENNTLSEFGLVKYSILFFGTHFFLVFGAGLVAAFGRAIQLGAMHEVPGALNILLEVIIGTARILTFLLVLGEGSIGRGRAKSRKSYRFESESMEIGLVNCNLQTEGQLESPCH